MKTLERKGKRLICTNEAECRALEECGGCTEDGRECPFAKVETIVEPIYEITTCCKKCGKMMPKTNPFIKENKLILVDECEHCYRRKPAISEELAVQFPNLTALIKELSAWTFDLLDDGFILDMESRFRFKFKADKKHITIWDENEVFNINVDEEDMAICHAGAKEFGAEYKKPESTIEKIQGRLLEALKKDTGKDLVLEWEDGVVMSAWF